MNITALVINIASGLTGAILYAIGRWLFNYRSEYIGAYTGIWRGEIIDQSGAVEKEDEYHFRHRGELVQGDIYRLAPPNQSHRRWKMYGRIRGRDFFALFWSNDQNVLSYGCWYLHQTSDFEFNGYYLRLVEGQSGVNVNPIKLRLTKTKP